jgi:DNA-binding SARP family transcriptional activator
MVRVLGPVAVTGPEGEVPLAGVLPRGFLAVLAIESPRPVSIDRLAALLWGDDCPAGVKAALQQLATRVRRSLHAAGIGEALVARQPGYALELPADQVDVRTFRDLVGRADELRRADDIVGAADTFTEALGLWRDAALCDLVELPLAVVLTPSLDDERWRAEERRADLLLSLGQNARAAEHLSAVTAHAPMRERLWVLAARALMADGLHADALSTVRSGMAVIAAVLGVPPGPDLLALEAELLECTPSTTVVTTDAAITAAPPVRSAGSARPPVDADSALGEAMRRALDKSEVAARSATARCAFDEAVRHWQRALELLDSVDRHDEARRFRLLMGLGDAHNLVSLDEEARAVFAAAADIARRRHDAEGFALAVLGYCAERNGLVPPPEQMRMLEEALAHLPATNSMLRGRVLGRLALEAYWSDIDRSLALAEEALQLAVECDDTAGRLSARYALAFGCWTPLRTERLLAELDLYLDESVAAGERMHELLAHRWMPPPMAEMGDVAGARREAAIAVELADELGNGVQQWMARQVYATIELLAGDLDRAASLAEEALMHGSVCEPTISFDFYSISMWTLAWLRGDLATFAPLVEQAASAPGADAARRGALALTYAELGRVDEAREVLTHFTDEVLESVDGDATWFMVMATVAEAAWHCGDRRCGATVARLLEPYVDRLAVNSVTATGPVAHAAGVAALAAGDVERGTALLHRAIEIGERAGTPVFVARTRAVLARL